MTVADLARVLRGNAKAYGRLGSAMYEALTMRVADDLEAGGPVADVLAGRDEDALRSQLALRLLGTVHGLVLAGRAPALAPYYPSVGGSFDVDAAWPALRQLLADQRDVVRAGLASPPQTNEVGRAAALIGGLLHVAAGSGMPVRLVEIGTSAGLNLRADRFRVTYAGGSWGPDDSPVLLADAWLGPLPPVEAPLRIVERYGCDLAPVDPLTEAGRIRLTAYVWPDQAERLALLRGAFQVAAQVPAAVVSEGAAAILERLTLRPGAVTVVWHSVVWQYLPDEEQARVQQLLDALGATATLKSPLAYLTMEPHPDWQGKDLDFPVTLRTWPGGQTRVLGHARPHGLPVTWSDAT